MIAPPAKPRNIVSFKNGTACVVFLPFATELTQHEKKRIDAARVLRFFVFGCEYPPTPTGISPSGTLDDYPAKSLGWAVSRSTYVHSEILPDLPPASAPQTLIKALLDADALAGTEDHRGVVTIVAPRPFTGCDEAIYRPSATPSSKLEAAS